MNVKRFTARSARDCLALVRQAFGEDAVVMSTRPCPDGVEMLAMAPESVQQLERVGAAADAASRASSPPSGAPMAAGQAANALSLSVRAGERIEPRFDNHEARIDPRPEPRGLVYSEPRIDPEIGRDLEQMQMSTLSFQDYVRDRMLKRREAERQAERETARETAREAARESVREADRPVPREPSRPALSSAERLAAAQTSVPTPNPNPVPAPAAPIEAARARHSARREVPVLREEVLLPHGGDGPGLSKGSHPATHGEQVEMLSELRSMRGLIEQRFGALAFMEKLQRQPRQAHLAQRLLDAGFSPALIRKLVQSLPADADEAAWTAHVLEHNLSTGERESALEDTGGIFALIGATGVGKTTSTAKLAAAFATRHGAANLGLITLDAYRVGAHEQLRTYGRILGVPVHTAHDRASLEDLLDLLSAKRMVLIDTAGMAQRDSRTRELLEMLSHRSINRLLVVNASAQGETIEDQLAAYAAPSCRGLVLSKLDEAVKLGPALDSMIRHKLKVLAVANGQRVPEDWHRLSANALVQRALKAGGSPAWRLDESDVGLIFAGLPALPAGVSPAAAAAAALRL
jgi:flagellar biosynthesis protein FlhF